MYPEKCSTSFYMVQGEKKNEIRGQAGSIRLPAHINNHADSSFSCFTYIHGTSTSVVVCQKQPDQHTIYSLCGCCRCIHDAGSFFYRWLRDDTQPEQDRYFLFRKEKDKRIGFPWIVCTLAFAPVLSLFVARQLGHDTSYLQMMGNLFWTKDYYYQDPYWFLYSAYFSVNNSIGRPFVQIQIIYWKNSDTHNYHFTSAVSGSRIFLRIFLLWN